MRPTYIKDYMIGLEADKAYHTMLHVTPWVNMEVPRNECFMSVNPLSYTYGKGFERTYESVDMHPTIKWIMDRLNTQFDCSYNVCFLNHYENMHGHLGWHSDDSPVMDAGHPIAVISLGAEREIWVKDKGVIGNIPECDKYRLANGSLFIMPAGYQGGHLHKIPKGDRLCGGRISLTFRRYTK